MQTIARPGSKPPPLPPHAARGSTPPSKGAESIGARTIRGVGGGKPVDAALDHEIDASLGILDALDNGPTGTSLPEPDDRTGENDQVPSTQDAAGGDLVTSVTSVINPHTVRDSGPTPTDRPRMSTDPSITTANDSAMPAPLTTRGADAEDPTGEIGTNDLLESTHSGPQDQDEEEIVIADDLAEIVDDGSNKDMADENTDAGTVPPYRPEG
jgi:hypothetical protein